MLLAATGVDCGQRGIDVGPGRLQLTITAASGEIAKSLKLNVAVAVWTSDPLVPVTRRVNVPAAALHETVAVPEPVTGTGEIAPQVRPVGTVSVRVTTPENPFTAVMVIVEVAEEPAATEAGEVAAIVKSTTWKRIGELVMLLDPEAVTVTV
jgi:hypothetical protein